MKKEYETTIDLIKKFERVFENSILYDLKKGISFDFAGRLPVEIIFTDLKHKPTLIEDGDYFSFDNNEELIKFIKDGELEKELEDCLQ